MSIRLRIHRDEEKLVTDGNLRRYKILIMFRNGLRFPNGYWHQVYWNEKKNGVTSVQQPGFEYE